MQPISTALLRTSCAAIAFAAIMATASAATLCVDKNPGSGCAYQTIGAAVAAAAAGDTIRVHAGRYAEDVHIQLSLSLLGTDPLRTIIDARGLANGIFIDGIGGGTVTPGKNTLAHLTVAGFTVENAKFEGILVANASYVTVRGNRVQHNDRALDIHNMTCPGLPDFETEEALDCGEAVHLTGVDHATVAANLVEDNSGGILLTDETGPTRVNVIEGNAVRDNPFDCGITLASHPPAALTGSASPFGVYNNTIAGNQSSGNGLQVGGEGAGVGLFAPRAGNLTFGNVVVGNLLTRNGLPGVAIHNHAANARIRLSDNVITGNFIAENGGDDEVETTARPTGISLLGTTRIVGTMIISNQFAKEAIGIAANNAGTVAIVSAHLNNLLGAGAVGIANFGTAAIDATENWWGCKGGPGAPGCSTVSGTNITFEPFSRRPLSGVQ